jgi:hypothetical protein
MNRSSTQQFKAGLDKAFSSLGERGGDLGVMMNAAKLKGSLSEEDVDIKFIRPNFDREFDEAKRYREFKRLSKKEWIDIAKEGSITTFEKIKKNLGNIDLDFEKLDKEKRARFQAAFKNKRIEAPIVVKFRDNDYDLLGGNTRLAGLVRKGLNPKLWLIDMSKSKKLETTEAEKLKGGKSDKMSLLDLAKKHAYDDSKDSTSKEKIEKVMIQLAGQLKKGMKVEMEHTKDKQKAKEIAMDHLSEDPKYYTKLEKVESNEDDKVTAKKQFSQDLQQDKDFQEFKKRAKYKQGYKDIDFGTPNVVSKDPYIKKRKWSRPGKEETFENIDKDLKGNDKEMVNGIIEILNQIEDKENRMKVAKNMIQKFKKEGIKFDYNDFFQKSDLNKKAETKEATGAASAGSYVGPFSMDSKFIKKSNAETPKSEIDEMQYQDYDLEPVKVATNNDGRTFRIGDRAIAFDRFKPIRIISLQKDNRGRVKAYHREGDMLAVVDIDGLIPLGKEVSKIEANEVTGASSAGQYSGPAMWAKSTSKKDWRGASKPLYKGGKFVQVKGKCKKFPYCNQGDIKALKIWENKNIQQAIKKVSENTGISDITIKGILQYEMSNISSKKV